MTSDIKNVLVLCDAFPPAMAPRMGYICKYLPHAGWRPTVITEEMPLRVFEFLKGETEVHYIRYRLFGDGLRAKTNRLWVVLTDLLFGVKDRRMYREAMRIVENRCFEVVFCSSFRVFPLPAALRVAHHLRLPLIVDIRDIIEQCADNEFIDVKLPRLLGLEKVLVFAYRRLLLSKRNRVLRAANYITTVSTWHVEVLKRYNPAVELIYNGFDPEMFYPAPVANSRFCIAYTGRMFNIALRDPSLLFEAVRRLANEKLITPQTFRIQWFTDEESRLVVCEAAQAFDIMDYMDFYGYAPAAEVPAILNKSAVLLILTNKSGDGGPNGIMTTKFFEAIAVERPILSVRGDEGCLEAVINNLRAGLSAHNANEVYDFLLSLYNQWLATGYTTVASDREAIQLFSRKSQALRFAELFMLVHSKP
jgi:glycosyltransferase involved in cell wall biosynthesis